MNLPNFPFHASKLILINEGGTEVQGSKPPVVFNQMEEGVDVQCCKLQTIESHSIIDELLHDILHIVQELIES